MGVGVWRTRFRLPTCVYIGFVQLVAIAFKPWFNGKKLLACGQVKRQRFNSPDQRIPLCAHRCRSMHAGWQKTVESYEPLCLTGVSFRLPILICQRAPREFSQRNSVLAFALDCSAQLLHKVPHFENYTGANFYGMKMIRRSRCY